MSNNDMKHGVLYFHQGWTDIINGLSLINYYCEKYDNIYLLIRKDAHNIIDFYTKNINNIKLVYLEKYILDSNGCGQGLNYSEGWISNSENNLLNFVKNKFNIIEKIDKLYIGGHDLMRDDEYKGVFTRNYFRDSNFCKLFYTSYNIPYETRISHFKFERDLILENKIYTEFTQKYGDKYILYHNMGDTTVRKETGGKAFDVSIIENPHNFPTVNLDNISAVIFDFIKVLENAIEIHLLDSFWGVFIYLLDAKYKLFKDKKITLYVKRGYYTMFTEPVKLDNWIIKR